MNLQQDLRMGYMRIRTPASGIHRHTAALQFGANSAIDNFDRRTTHHYSSRVVASWELG